MYTSQRIHVGLSSNQLQSIRQGECLNPRDFQNFNSRSTDVFYDFVAFWTLYLSYIGDAKRLNVVRLPKFSAPLYSWRYKDLMILSWDITFGLEKTNHNDLSDYFIRLQIWKCRVNCLAMVFNYLLFIFRVSSLNVRKVQECFKPTVGLP